MKRREFLHVVSAAGAGAAAVAASGCEHHGSETLIPYLAAVPNASEGVSVEYSTVCRECPAGCGMIARARDGRVYMVEGNPDHPINRGALCMRGTASLQGLYNPDRFRQPLTRDSFGRLAPISWAEAEARLDAAISSLGGRSVAWIGRTETGALDQLIDIWLGVVSPQVTRYRYELYGYEALRVASARVFGTAGSSIHHVSAGANAGAGGSVVAGGFVVKGSTRFGAIPEFRIQNAQMLLSFGADFLETWISNVEYTRQFAEWRDARSKGAHRGRYVFISPRLSLTGANADEWVRVRPGAEGLVARALGYVVAAQRGRTAVPVQEIGTLADASGVPAARLERLGREFGSSVSSLALPLGFAATGAGAADAEEAVLRLNTAVGGVGTTILPGEPHALSTLSSYADMVDLVGRMNRGEIGLVFLHGANPAYTIPPSSGFVDALARVPHVISFASYPDDTTGAQGETGGGASLVLPDHAFLESWGDYSPRPGVTGMLQPAMAPLFDTRQTGDVLLASAARLGHPISPSFEAYVRGTFGLAPADWMEALQHGGIFTGTAVGSGSSSAGSVSGSPGIAGSAGVTYRDLTRVTTSSPASAEGIPLALRDDHYVVGPGGTLPGSGGVGGFAAVPPADGSLFGPGESGERPIADQPGNLAGGVGLLSGAQKPDRASVSLTEIQTPPDVASSRPTSRSETLMLQVYPSLQFFDGRLANRPWSQEIPDATAKAVWGSWVEIHPEQAKAMGVETGRLLVVSTKYGKIEAPALISDRVQRQVVSLMIGQGHAHSGSYATGRGVNPLVLLGPEADSGSGALVAAGQQAQVQVVDVRRPLVILQTSEKELGERIAQSVTLDEIDQHAQWKEEPPGSGLDSWDGHASFYANQFHPEHHWGMAIDLNRCVGCNACVAACYAENNVPIVGHDECARGREMSWLRIENYVGPAIREVGSPEAVETNYQTYAELHSDEPDQVDVRFLPMLCQQCDNAPCEYVCPVFATLHDNEGLNLMVYNRCIGTRFCSNNCPYKVRRFNWFDYRFPSPLDQQLNPDVEHRTKGIMEKCTFCVQRIRAHEIQADLESRPLRDGEIQTACMQACPADAIVFGDLDDRKSRVSELVRSPRGYAAMGDLNTFPNVIYLSRVRAK